MVCLSPAKPTGVPGKIRRILGDKIRSNFPLSSFTCCWGLCAEAFHLIHWIPVPVTARDWGIRRAKMAAGHGQRHRVSLTLGPRAQAQRARAAPAPRLPGPGPVPVDKNPVNQRRRRPIEERAHSRMQAPASPVFEQRIRFSFASDSNSVLFFWHEGHWLEDSCWVLTPGVGNISSGPLTLQWCLYPEPW